MEKEKDNKVVAALSSGSLTFFLFCYDTVYNCMQNLTIFSKTD